MTISTPSVRVVLGHKQHLNNFLHTKGLVQTQAGLRTGAASNYMDAGKLFCSTFRRGAGGGGTETKFLSNKLAKLLKDKLSFAALRSRDEYLNCIYKNNTARPGG
jgi:hypothetical protein